MEIFAETNRLLLREILPTDDQAMFELDSDPDVHRYLGNQPVTHIDQIRKVIAMIRQQYVDYGIGRWAVIEKSSNDFVGWSGLKWMTVLTNNHIHYYDLGYRFLQKYWGKGFATEAGIASLAYGFEQLNQEKIYAMADVGNMGSRKVLEKCGMRMMGEFLLEREAHCWFEMGKGEWDNNRLGGV